MNWHETPGLSQDYDGLGGGDALLFTTNPGLEDLVADELCEALVDLGRSGDVSVERKPHGFAGHLLALLPRLDPEVIDAALGLRCVHHVLHPLYGFALPDGARTDPLDRIHAELKERGVPQLAAEGVASFRVSTHRSGDQAFTSIDVQRRAGAALVERYGLAVDLRHFDCEVRVDVDDDRCTVGVQLTGPALSHRPYRLYKPRAALKVNVACGLLRLARLCGGRILDPFCGSATIPIEAALAHPDLEIEASDYSEQAVAGARRNLQAAGLTERIHVRCRNVVDLADAYPAGHFDALVTNPPFGVRLARGMNFLAFYGRFLDVAAHLLRPGGRLVFLAWKRGVIDHANRPTKRFRRTHVRVVETGGIYPRAYVMERKSG